MKLIKGRIKLSV